MLPAGFLRWLLGGVVNEERVLDHIPRDTVLPPACWVPLTSAQEWKRYVSARGYQRTVKGTNPKYELLPAPLASNRIGAILPPLKASGYACVTACIGVVTPQTLQQRASHSQRSRLVHWTQLGSHCCPSPWHQVSPKCKSSIPAGRSVTKRKEVCHWSLWGNSPSKEACVSWALAGFRSPRLWTVALWELQHCTNGKKYLGISEAYVRQLWDLREPCASFYS